MLMQGDKSRQIFSHTLKSLNPFGAEATLFWDNKVHTMAADALASCVTRKTAAMVLIT